MLNFKVWRDVQVRTFRTEEGKVAKSVLLYNIFVIGYKKLLKIIIIRDMIRIKEILQVNIS